MKKLLLVGAFVISAVSFANTHEGSMNGMNMNGMNMNGMNMNGMNMNGGMMGGMNKCQMMDGMMNGGMMNGGMMGGMMNNMTPELRKQMQDDMIKVQEKQLEISKIMNTSKPDMKKVEKLNSEISTIRANHMTKMQQNMMKSN